MVFLANKSRSSHVDLAVLIEGIGSRTWQGSIKIDMTARFMALV
jgi:hypothetical protein